MNLSFIEKTDEMVKPLWQAVFGKFYYEKTHIFYDYLAEDGPNGFLKAMPTPEMVKYQIPNPCGWSTPMEDSEGQNGAMMKALIFQYKMTKDETILPVLHDVAKGWLKCATVSGQRGFIARSVAPDGESHYINSSRDHYTYWVYDAVEYYESGFATKEEKQTIVDCLAGVAEKAEKEIHGDKYEFLREDGKVGMVCKMWGKLDPHEYLRLPMIYLAAYHVSGNKHWKDKYLEYREEAFDGSEKIFDKEVMKIFIYSYALSQMQLSLALVRDYEEDEEYRKRAEKMMKYVSDFSVKYTLEGIKEADKPQADDYNNWMEAKFDFWGLYAGYAYYCAEIGPTDSRYMNMVHVFDPLYMQLLCKNEKIDVIRKDNFYKMLKATDFTKSTFCNMPLNYLFLYTFLKYRENVENE